jgi:hemolysin III
MLSKLREPVNGLTHLGGAILGFIGMIAMLIIARGAALKVASVLVYSFGLMAMFFASGIYHSAIVKPSVQQILRKIDHSAIFLLIAGTYTPFCLLAFTGFWHWGLLALIWAIAAIGIVVKVFYIKSPRWLHTGIYVLMGWICVMAAPQMPSVLPTAAMVWLFVGGVIYTLGAVVYATKALDFVPGKFGFHEVWHIFVLLGALAHFIAIMSLLALPPVA